MAIFSSMNYVKLLVQNLFYRILILFIKSIHIGHYFSKISEYHYCHKESNKSTNNIHHDFLLFYPQTWRLAGGRIVDFCKGMTMILLQETKPDFQHSIDPFYNLLPEDENDIIQKRVADVVLTPLKVRTKRRALAEERERLNEEEEYLQMERRKREAAPYRGRFRGQTQSQYLNVGNEGQKEGKAEAEATQQSSRAVVSECVF